GIRDLIVTGVQTCALPIYQFPRQRCGTTGIQGARISVYSGDLRVFLIAWSEEIADQASDDRSDGDGCPRIVMDVAVGHTRDVARSEERRVGKECGCGWGA